MNEPKRAPTRFTADCRRVTIVDDEPAALSTRSARLLIATVIVIWVYAFATVIRIFL